jgi:hypothetical protein
MRERVRVYFNKRGPLPWSIDYGDQESEIHVRMIQIVDVQACTREDFSNPDPEKPTAWFEFFRVNVTIEDERATLWR